MKTLFKMLPAASLIIFLLSGCQSYSEIENALMVSGIAVDKTEEGLIKVTAEIVDMQGGETAPLSSRTLFSENETVFGALQNINAKSPKKLYFGQATLIAVSEDVSRDGLINIIDLIIRDDQLRITNDVVIAKEVPASALFEAQQTDEQIRSYEISAILQNERDVASIVPEVQVFELINIIGSDGVSAILPAFTLNDEGALSLWGTAYFNDDKLAGFLNAHDSQLMSLIQGETKEGFITLKIKTDTGEFLTAEIFESKTKIKTKEEKGKIFLDITVDAEVGISELITQEDLMSHAGRKKLMETLEKHLENNISDLIIKMQQEGKDVFGFGERIYKQHPKIWENLRNTNYFKNISFKVNVKTNLRSTGFIAKSPSSRDFRIEEVK